MAPGAAGVPGLLARAGAGRARRGAPSVGDAGGRAGEPYRARAARRALSAREPRRRRRADRADPRRNPRLVWTSSRLERRRASPRDSREPGRSASARRGRPAVGRALAVAARRGLAHARGRRARATAGRSVGGAARGAVGPRAVHAFRRAARLRPTLGNGMVPAAHARHRARPAPGPAADRRRHVHPSSADRRAVLRGDAGPGPITRLAEELDGRSLFGRPLESLDAETFNGYAAALGIGVVVALDEDAGRLSFLDDNRDFNRRAAPAPFVVFGRHDGVDLPCPVAGGRSTITLTPARDGWASARATYYPLWYASVGGAPLPTRRGRLGDLEVGLAGDGPRMVDLAYRPGVAEISGVVVSALGSIVWLASLRSAKTA